MLRAAKAPLTEGERAAVYLTDTLTGWAMAQEPEAPDTAQRGLRYIFPPLADERERGGASEAGEVALLRSVRPGKADIVVA